MIQFLLQTPKLRTSLFIYLRKQVDYGAQNQIKQNLEYFFLDNKSPEIYRVLNPDELQISWNQSIRQSFNIQLDQQIKGRINHISNQLKWICSKMDLKTSKNDIIKLQRKSLKMITRKTKSTHQNSQVQPGSLKPK
ncbi:unnamed protein product [Paramecium octaurelia]|uniref:Uncharacterized protein n=1 Tax=Paramecium octaurelia TaxID=43137 RepID=A0A8S1XSN0_PAROT|nr:unnamed protein product [Paramecium octaurelia]